MYNIMYYIDISTKPHAFLYYLTSVGGWGKKEKRKNKNEKNNITFYIHRSSSDCFY